MKSIFGKPLTAYEAAETWGRLHIACGRAERAAGKQDIVETRKMLDDANALLQQLVRNEAAKLIKKGEQKQNEDAV